MRTFARWTSGAAVMVVTLAASLIFGQPAYGADISYPPGLPATADPLSSLESEDGCDPTAKPGTLALRDLLVNLYPFVTGEHGISRACSPESSGHEIGQALDWFAHVDDPEERAAGQEFVNLLLDDDPFGNPYGGARRMGIMYMIWNYKIWGSYLPDAGWRTYTGSNPHVDHIHFSMSRAGSRCNTTWWVATNCTGDVPRPQGWSNIVEADLDGDGDDEIGFYRNVDGRMSWYEMTAGGGLGTQLSSRDLSPSWNKVVGADLDGDGDDEVAFYRRSDGRWQVYEMTADGSGLGTALTARNLSPTWNEIVAADLDGDGDDEMSFYRRSDGRWQTYEMSAAGNPGEALDSRDLSPTWREIFAGDWDGNGNDEGAFYRRSDGRLQTYQMTAVGGLGAALNSYDINDDWTEIVSADLDGDGDDETGFYRGSDGLFVTYEMSASGSLGTRINSLDLYP